MQTNARPARYVRARILLFFTYLLHLFLFGLGRIFLRKVSMEIHGAHHLHTLTKGAVFAPNHTSVLDPIILCIALARSRMLKRLLPLISVAREKSFYRGMEYPQPIIYGGILFRLLGALEVTPRSAQDPKHANEDPLAMHAQLLTDGFSVLIFPEGHITRDGNLLPPKLGASRLSQRTQRPLIPVALDGSFDLDPWNLVLGRTHIVVTFTEPICPHVPGIYPDAYYAALSEEMMRQIAQALRH